MSSLIPRAPWVWIARSTTSCITPATWNLISEIASRACGDALGVDRPGRVQDQEPRGVDRRPALGDPVLHGLPAAERVAGGELARGGPVAHQLERAPAHADPAHRSAGFAPGPAGPGPSRTRPLPRRAGSRAGRGSPRKPARRGWPSRRRRVPCRKCCAPGESPACRPGRRSGWRGGGARRRGRSRPSRSRSCAPSAAEANHLRPLST